MQYEVIPTPKFEKDLKKLGKKNRGIAEDIEPVLEDMERGNFKGDIIPMNLRDNNNVAIKIRIANASSQKGKSGRV